MIDTNILPPIWNIPYQRNPFFTGREEVLTHLHDELRAEHATALTQPQGVSGLGGIGKTQTALEHAYRYHDDYQPVLWARADSLECSPQNLLVLLVCCSYQRKMNKIRI